MSTDFALDDQEKPRLSLKERQRLVREEAILDSAYEHLAGKGYEELNLEALVAEVGISKSTLYQHFPSKDELVVAVILRLMRRGEERLATLDPQLAAIERLEELVRGGLERRSAVWGGMGSMLPLTLRQHPKYQAQWGRMLARLNTLVDEAKAAGDIDPALSTPVVTRTLAHLFQIDYSELAGGDPDERRATSAMVTRLVFNGLRARHEG